MKTLILISAIALSSMVSCSKGVDGGGGGNPPPGGEVPLQVATTPTVNTTAPASVDVDFPLRIMITSTMPPQGVTIDVTSKKDDGSGAAPFYSTSLTSSATIHDFTITNTPLNVICIVNIAVTSRTSPTNRWTGSYRYSRK